MPSFTNKSKYQRPTAESALFCTSNISLTDQVFMFGLIWSSKAGLTGIKHSHRQWFWRSEQDRPVLPVENPNRPTTDKTRRNQHRVPIFPANMSSGFPLFSWNNFPRHFPDFFSSYSTSKVITSRAGQYTDIIISGFIWNRYIVLILLYWYYNRAKIVLFHNATSFPLLAMQHK